MNIINVKVNFKNRTMYKQGVYLTSGDYNSTKMVFDFDVQDGIKILEMKSPSGKLVLVTEIKNNEVILIGKTEDGNVASLFNETGDYVYEISLYDGESKLTSAFDKIKVKQEQVVIDGEVVTQYLPIFDELINTIQDLILQVDTLDIDIRKQDNKSTITITKKDGKTKTVEVLDGEKGEKGFSPSAKVEQTDTGAVITVEDENSKTTANITNGKNGIDGYTPIVGKDYFTEEEQENFKNEVINSVKPTLDNNLKESKDYTDNAIVRDFKDISYDSDTATFVFTRHDNTTFTVDLPIEQTVKNGYYDETTKELVLVLVSDQEIRIPATGLIDDFTGVTSATIQCTISADNKITCNIVGGSISKTLLTTELQEEINNKINKSSFVYDEENETLTITI